MSLIDAVAIVTLSGLAGVGVFQAVRLYIDEMFPP